MSTNKIQHAKDLWSRIHPTEKSLKGADLHEIEQTLAAVELDALERAAQICLRLERSPSCPAYPGNALTLAAEKIRKLAEKVDEP